jgi:hypothetical protein
MRTTDAEAPSFFERERAAGQLNRYPSNASDSRRMPVRARLIY